MESWVANGSAAGPNGHFNTTHWSVVLLAGEAPSTQSGAALESLCRSYWPPVYWFARRRNYSEADAKDLTQQFFYQLLQRQDFSGLTPQKGKFRTFLLTAFTHFLANETDRIRAQKRGGDYFIVSLDELSLDELEVTELAEPHPQTQYFDVKWAALLVKQGFAAVKQEMLAAGKGQAFEVLKAFLAMEAAPGQYQRAAQALGVVENSVGVLVHRLRQRFRQLVRAQVAQTVSSLTELEEEMRYLFEVLNRP